MIKLLLVDDEPIIRRGIRTSIEWDRYGIEIAGEAANGNDALEKAELLRPHVVLTDIRMPFMDGLELAKQLKTVLPDTRIVILSGYQDFAYAKEALTIGVQDYLLKPVGAEELIALLERLKGEIESEEALRRVRLSRDLAFNENYPAIKSDFVGRIIRGTAGDHASIREKARQLGLRLDGRNYAVMAIGIDDYAGMTEDMPAAERELLRYAVLNIAEELLTSRTSGLVCYSEFDHLIGLACLDGNPADFAGSLGDDIRQCVKTYLKLTVSVGIGTACGPVAELGGAYAEAFTALKARIHRGKDSLILYQELGQTALSQAVIYPSEEEKTIIGCLKTLDAAGTSAALDQVFARFAAAQADAESIRSICGRLILLSASGIEEMGIDAGKAIGADYNPYRELARYDTLDALRQHAGAVLQRLIDLVQENKNMKFKGIIKAALRYMEDNYDKDLSLADTAAVVYVTPNYLSRIFKEEMGINFVEWLNRYRIGKAKALLAEPGAKTYSIAEKVGYSDYKYFSQIFKRYAGCSPKEYKELRMQQ